MTMQEPGLGSYPSSPAKQAFGTGRSIVRGPIALKASNSPVRHYAGQVYEVLGPARLATLTLRAISAANVPDAKTSNVLTRSYDAADPYVRARLMNADVRCDASTTHRENDHNPQFVNDLLLLTLPAGLEPDVLIEIWDKDKSNDDDKLASLRLKLPATGGVVEHVELRRAKGLEEASYSAMPPTISFEYSLEETAQECDGWSEVLA